MLNAQHIKTFKVLGRHHAIFASNLLHPHKKKLHWGFVPGSSDFMIKQRTRKTIQHSVDKWLVDKM